MTIAQRRRPNALLDNFGSIQWALGSVPARPQYPDSNIELVLVNPMIADSKMTASSEQAYFPRTPKPFYEAAGDRAA